jgi:DNA-binding transcriptional ArsR family regulator
MVAELDVLHVIAEPTRRKILDHVRAHDRSVGELVELTGMHQPGVSRHLRVLRDAGLVDVRVDAQRRIYHLRAEPLAELDAWLAPYRAHWSSRLDALERHLDGHPGRQFSISDPDPSIQPDPPIQKETP